jgi:alkylation response protein AidB-like acyl-CoA dehydrogenase
MPAATWPACDHGRGRWGHLVINGAKTFISNGINCDLLVLAARDPAVKTNTKRSPSM